MWMMDRKEVGTDVSIAGMISRPSSLTGRLCTAHCARERRFLGLQRKDTVEGER
jgi:hypothetical protein